RLPAVRTHLGKGGNKNHVQFIHHSKFPIKNKWAPCRPSSNKEASRRPSPHPNGATSRPSPANRQAAHRPTPTNHPPSSHQKPNGAAPRPSINTLCPIPSLPHTFPPFCRIPCPHANP